MTKKLLSSTNTDHAPNGPTLVLDVNENQHFHHKSCIGCSQQNWPRFGSIEDCKGMQLKGQETAHISSKAPIKSVLAATSRMCSNEASWPSCLAWDWQGFLWLLSHTHAPLCTPDGQIARRGIEIWQTTFKMFRNPTTWTFMMTNYWTILKFT